MMNNVVWAAIGRPIILSWVVEDVDTYEIILHFAFCILHLLIRAE